MITWYWWVAAGLALTVVGVVLIGRGLTADFDRPFVAKVICGGLLVFVGAGVGTVPVGFPELTGVESVRVEEMCG